VFTSSQVIHGATPQCDLGRRWGLIRITDSILAVQVMQIIPTFNVR
jgi:hypothetical protein